jgi:hypothetical protein
MTGLIDRGLVVRLGSLAVVRKRAGRGSFAPGAPGAAKEPRVRGPGRALSSDVMAICTIGDCREVAKGTSIRAESFFLQSCGKKAVLYPTADDVR